MVVNCIQLAASCKLEWTIEFHDKGEWEDFVKTSGYNQLFRKGSPAWNEM
jgi:hypothetical protein